MAKRRKLTTIDEAKPTKRQHKIPCSDCPWRRSSIPGWLGGVGADDWITEVHSDEPILCHTMILHQCAGSAIYRRNVGKLSRDSEVICLEADREKVFSSPMEFKRHHEL